MSESHSCVCSGWRANRVNRDSVAEPRLWGREFWKRHAPTRKQEGQSAQPRCSAPAPPSAGTVCYAC